MVSLIYPMCSRPFLSTSIQLGALLRSKCDSQWPDHGSIHLVKTLVFHIRLFVLILVHGWISLKRLIAGGCGSEINVICVGQTAATTTPCMAAENTAIGFLAKQPLHARGHSTETWV